MNSARIRSIVIKERIHRSSCVKGTLKIILSRHDWFQCQIKHLEKSEFCAFTIFKVYMYVCLYIFYNKVNLVGGKQKYNLIIICIWVFGVMGLVWFDYLGGYNLKKIKCIKQRYIFCKEGMFCHRNYVFFVYELVNVQKASAS